MSFADRHYEMADLFFFAFSILSIVSSLLMDIRLVKGNSTRKKVNWEKKLKETRHGKV